MKMTMLINYNKHEHDNKINNDQIETKYKTEFIKIL